FEITNLLLAGGGEARFGILEIGEGFLQVGDRRRFVSHDVKIDSKKSDRGTELTEGAILTRDRIRGVGWPREALGKELARGERFERCELMMSLCEAGKARRFEDGGSDVDRAGFAKQRRGGERFRQEQRDQRSIWIVRRDAAD